MPVKRPRLFHVLCCAAFALPLAGCSSSAAMRSVGSEEADGREIFGDIERLEFAKSVQVRLPARLAVADAGTARSTRPWRTSAAPPAVTMPTCSS